jgi:hypothetical protein
VGKRDREVGKRARGRVGSPAAIDALPTTHGVAPPLIVGPAALPTSEKYVLGESVTHRCVELIADAIASAKWTEWRNDEPIEPPSRLVRRPWGDYDGGPTRRDWAWKVAATMALYSWCPLLRTGGTDSEGVVGSLVPVLPGDVGRIPGSRNWTYRGEDVGPRGIRVILRTVWPSIDSEVASVLALARNVFAAAMAATAAEAAFWDAGGAPHTVLTYEKGSLPQATLDELRAKYVQQRIDNPGQPAVLAGGLKLEAFGGDLGTSGAGEAAARVGAAVARYFGVPPHYANVPNYASSLTYQNTETAGIDFVRYTLSAYAASIGDALGEELPGDGVVGRTVRLDLGHLTRAEQESRARSWQMALGTWMTREEVRMAEGLPAAPLAGTFETAEPPPPAEAAPQLQLVEGAA